MKKTELNRMKKSELLELAHSAGLEVPGRILKRDLVGLLFKKLKDTGTKRAGRGSSGGRGSVKAGTRKRAVSGSKKKRPSKKAAAPKKQASPREEEKAFNNRTIRDKAVEGKYYLTKESTRSFLETETSEIPPYGKTRIVTIVRDPYWLFAYWEIARDDMKAARENCGSQWPSCRMILRVYDLSKDPGGRSYFDIEVGEQPSNWYMNVSPEHNYQVGIGILAPDGIYREIALSDVVQTPREGVSEKTDEEWAVPESRYSRILEASGEALTKTSSEELSAGGPGPGAGSESVSSFGQAASQPEERRESFVKIELVLYGSAGKGSRLSFMGREVEANPDGTFSLRMELPEGEIEIPMKLISPEGKWEKKIKTAIDTEKS